MLENWLSTVIFIEVVATILIVWGFLHEDKVVAFEDRIIKAIRKKIRKAKRDLCARWLAKQGLEVTRRKDEKNV